MSSLRAGASPIKEEGGLVSHPCCSTMADAQAMIALSLRIMCMLARALIKPSDVTLGIWHWRGKHVQTTGIVIFSTVLTYGRSPWDIFTRKMEETFIISTPVLCFLLPCSRDDISMSPKAVQSEMGFQNDLMVVKRFAEEEWNCEAVVPTAGNAPCKFTWNSS